MICIVEVGLMLLSVGLSMLAAYLLKPKAPKSPFDNKPTTLTTRGSYVPWLVGERRVAPVFGWAGSREIRKEKVKTAGGGKGFAGGSQEKVSIYFEAGWHQIAVGPVDELSGIFQGGKCIWDGAINSTSHPSGSLIELGGNEGSFYIFWGELDQPINTFLGDADRVGISSRWPGLCYVVWNKKRLGSSPAWPQLEYTVSRKVTTEVLTESANWITPSRIPTGSIFNVSGFHNEPTEGTPADGFTKIFLAGGVSGSDLNGTITIHIDAMTDAVISLVGNHDGVEGEGYFSIGPHPGYAPDGDWTSHLETPLGDSIYLNGNSMANGDYDVDSAEFVPEDPGDEGESVTYNATRLYLEGGVSGADGFGYIIEPYVWYDDDGDPHDAQMEIPIKGYLDGAEGVGYLSIGGNWAIDLSRGDIQVQGNGIGDGTYNLLTLEYVAHSEEWDEELRGYLEISGDFVWYFQKWKVIRLSGNGIADGDYLVDYAEYVSGKTRVYLEENVKTADGSGTVMQYNKKSDSGVNPAHAIAEMLFAPWPFGLGLDSTKWDLTSLEEVGTHMSLVERLNTSWFAPDGLTVQELLGSGMQDLGLAIFFHTRTGLLTFKLVRDPDESSPSEIISISADIILEPLPKIETDHDSRGVDRLVFSFPDRDFSYRNTTISIDDDGHSGRLEYANAREVSLPVINQFDAAATVAERRSQEELSGAVAVALNLNRKGRELLPGDVLDVDDFDELLRVTGVEFQGDSGTVKILTIVDVFGAPTSTYKVLPGRLLPDPEPPAPDLAFRILEIPEYLMPRGEQAIGVPRIRDNALVARAATHFSLDDSSYTFIDYDDNLHTGGTLIDAMAADDNFYQEEGPTFTILGPDIASATLDLSADETSWRKGRQVAVIGDEILFVQKITAIDSTTYRLDGVLRARYDTRRELHSVGDTVFIFSNTNLKALQDILLGVGITLYVKSQPEPVSLDSIEPAEDVLYGKGIRPMSPENLRLTSPIPCVPAFETGNDLVAIWDYLSALTVGSGAGMQGYGIVGGVADVDGQFLLEILDGSDTLIRSEILDEPTYTYTNATMVSDFGSEPASLKLRVSSLRGGYASETDTLTVTRL